MAMPAGVIAVPGLGLGVAQPDEVVARRPRLRIAVRPSPRRVAGIAFASVTVTLLALFAAAVFQTVLVQGQQRLDRLDRDVSQAQDRFDRLRADVAELESPERIVTVAHHRLGMVQPDTITYLAPTLEQVVSVVSASGRALPSETEADAAIAGEGPTWSQLKPFVGSAP
jgi:cell division protein FtsB